MKRISRILLVTGLFLVTDSLAAQTRATPTPRLPRQTPTPAPTATPMGGGVPLPTRTPVGEASCLGVVFQVLPNAEMSLPGTSSTLKISASKVVNLGMSVLFPATRSFAANEVMEVRVKTPRGHLYQKLDVPVQPDGTSEPQRRMAGYPYPVQVSRAQPATLAGERYLAVSAPPLQVGGTAITKGGLYGLWTVEAWPPGATRPCSGQVGIAQ